jgi:methionine synthase II (cobalamin-independent)
MSHTFKANGHCLLIGSLPLQNHREAADLVFKYAPGIPLWVQLPRNPQERMIPQFMPGLPGLKKTEDRMFLETSAPDFDQQVLGFYEEYVGVEEGHRDLNDTRFVLTPDTAEGFHVFVSRLRELPSPPRAIKGQVTGPFTFCTGVHDENKNAIFYNEQLRDLGVKLLALKTRWQVRQLSAFHRPVIVFCDEPALAGFGTSEFISISRDDVAVVLSEVIDVIHAEGGLAGVHVCANTDWSLILDSAADIVSFDAYSYFDRFALYADSLKQFVAAGKILAMGIVPTGNVEDIEKETAESLYERLANQLQALENLGMDRRKLIEQMLITPSCGTGSLPVPAAEKVLKLTREVSERLRAQNA